MKVASDIYSASATTATRSPTASRKGKGGKTIHPTREKAVEALKWAMNKNGGKWELTRSDIYHDRSGKEVAGVLRFDDHAAGQKTYRPIRAVAGGWQIGDPAGKWPLLNLHEISTAEKSKPVFIAEGEKACEAGSVIGLLCTTSAHGAKSPQKTDWSPLEGRNVVILPDNDEAGRAYAVDVARRCREAGALSVKEVILPNLPEGGDLYEFKNAGGTAKDVFKLAEQSETMTESEPDNVEPDTLAGIEPLGDPIEAAKAGTPYAMTDLGNAERLSYRFGDIIKFDIARNCWRRWNGKKWESVSTFKIITHAGESARTIRREAAEAPTKGANGGDVAGELWTHAKRSESKERLSACVEVVKSILGIAVDASEWDSDFMLFNVKNGTIDLRTGKLRPHDKTDMITRISNIDYDPEAKSKRLEKFLEDATDENEELKSFLQRAAGYTLSGNTSEEVLFMVYGVTASGKTTFLETLKSILGEYAATIDPAMLCKTKQGGSTGGNATPELARLAGVRMAGGSELEQGRELNEATVKNITGGETITARHLYGDLFSVSPTV